MLLSSQATDTQSGLLGLTSKLRMRYLVVTAKEGLEDGEGVVVGAPEVPEARVSYKFMLFPEIWYI